MYSIPYFSSAPEMAPYLDSPKAMHIGAPGKRGYLRLGFEIDSRGKCILRQLDRRAPIIVQQALYFDEAMPEMPCVYILSSGGPHIDGDRYRQEIVMKRESYAFISTGAATKLAGMRYNFSGLSQHFKLEEGSYLEYLPEPVIPCRHTRFISDTLITAHPSATLLYAEIFTGGRKFYDTGETFSYDILSVCTRGERPDGNPLFREKMVIRPEKVSPRALGIMDDYDVFANVVVLTPPDKAEEIYRQTPAFITPGMAAGITRLPHRCGLLYKVLGRDTEAVKKEARHFASRVRQTVKGRPLPEEFPWR